MHLIVVGGIVPSEGTGFGKTEFDSERMVHMEKTQGKKAVLVKAAVVANRACSAMEVDTLDIQLSGMPLDIVEAARKAVAKGRPLTLVVASAKQVAETRRIEIQKADAERRRELARAEAARRKAESAEEAARKAREAAMEAFEAQWTEVESWNEAIEEEADPTVRRFLIAGLPDIAADFGEVVPIPKSRKANGASTSQPSNGSRTTGKAATIRNAMPGTIDEIVARSGLDRKIVAHYVAEYVKAGRFLRSTDSIPVYSVKAN